MKPTLKEPASKRSNKLKYDTLLSSFSFNFNLHRYMKDGQRRVLDAIGKEPGKVIEVMVGRCRLKPLETRDEVR